MQTLFVINKRAGLGQHQRIVASFLQQLKATRPFGYELQFTQAPGDARRIAEQGLDAGASRIVAVGGDGTVSEVVNAIRDNDVSMGILPTGWNNNFALMHGILPNARAWLKMLCEDHTIPVDLARVNHRYFVTAAGAGFDGLLNRSLQEHPSLRRVGRPGVFLSSLHLSRKFKPFTLRLKVDGVDYKIQNTWWASIGNTRYACDQMLLFPHAETSDNKLDICIAANMNRRDFLDFLPLFYKGEHVNLEDYVMYLRGRDIYLDIPDDVQPHVDGDPFSRRPLRIRLADHPLRLVAPV